MHLLRCRAGGHREGLSHARSKIEPPLATTARSYAFLPAAQQGKYTVNVDS